MVLGEPYSPESEAVIVESGERVGLGRPLKGGGQRKELEILVEPE